MIQVVLVNDNDEKIGLEEKVIVHLGQGKLHRAFCTLIFGNHGNILITKRSKEKMLWPLFWDTTSASHPFDNEDFVSAGERRLPQEVGFECRLKMVDKFQYKESFGDIGSENEICATLIGTYDGDVNIYPDEVDSYKWISVDDLLKDINENQDIYTVWLKIAIHRLIERNIISGGNV